jgi:hypothetical protein
VSVSGGLKAGNGGRVKAGKEAGRKILETGSSLDFSDFLPIFAIPVRASGLSRSGGWRLLFENWGYVYSGS